MKVWVGTSGYNYPEWKGTFYPADLAVAKMLSYYAERFSTVEINATFYRMPSAKMMEQWAASTPDGFNFVLKAPKRITHDARLKNIDEPLGYFCRTARLLGTKLGPVLFQLPPYFKKDLPRLADLLGMLPADLKTAFEFRHASWFSDDIYQLLTSRNAALCAADTEKGTTPLVVTADFGYFRLRDKEYSDDDLEKWREAINLSAAQWRNAFVYFKHEESGIGAALAQRFQKLFGD
ncbi:MAG: DUF72 domain-containing protein [Candidatus Binatia bacterium]